MISERMIIEKATGVEVVVSTGNPITQNVVSPAGSLFIDKTGPGVYVSSGASWTPLQTGSTSWASISGKPTTIAGYGITDAYTMTAADARYVLKAGDTMTGLLIVPVLKMLGTGGYLQLQGTYQGFQSLDLGGYLIKNTARYWDNYSSDTVSGGFYFRASDAVVKGTVYWDVSGFGLLNNGGNWAVLAANGGGGTLYGNWIVYAGYLAVGTAPGNPSVAGVVALRPGGTNIGYVEWYTYAGVRQGYMGYFTSGITIQMEVGNFIINTASPGGSFYVNSSEANIAYLNTTYSLGGYLTWRKSGTERFYIGDSTAISGSGTGIDLYAQTGFDVSIYAGAVLRLRALAASGGTLYGTWNVGGGYLTVGAFAGTGGPSVGDIIARRSATTGAYFASDSGSVYLYFDAANWIISGGVNAFSTANGGLPDAMLTSNIPRKNTGSTFSGTNTFTVRADFYGANAFDYGSAGIWLREYNVAGVGTEYGPRLGFHWGSVVASQIGVEWAGHGGITTGITGRIAILNNPGTGYEKFIAGNLYVGGGYGAGLQGETTALFHTRESYMGYSSGYKVVVLGDLGGTQRLISIGYVPTGNTSGSFNGNSANEVLWVNAVRWLMPNSTNNNYLSMVAWDISANATFGGSVTTIGALTSGTYISSTAQISSGSYINAATYIAAATYFYADTNFGSGLVGVYDATRYRMIYAMGNAYKIALDGTSMTGAYAIFFAYDYISGYKNITGLSYGHGFGLVTNGTIRLYLGELGAWFTTPITATDFILGSDVNLKQDLVLIDSALDKVDKLSGYTFRYKSDLSRRRAGVLLQEVREVLPEATLASGVSYDSLVPLLIQAVKELRAEVKCLAA